MESNTPSICRSSVYAVNATTFTELPINMLQNWVPKMIAPRSVVNERDQNQVGTISSEENI